MVLFWLALVVCVNAEVWRGTYSSKEGFAFVGKFCFDADKTETVGELHVQLKKQKGQSVKDMEVLIYDDQPENWPMIYDRGYKPMTCEKRQTFAKNWYNVPNTTHAQATLRVRWDDEDEYGLQHMRFVEATRPRWWYIVIANCESFEKVEAVITFRNTLHGTWNEQLGADQRPLNTFYIFYTFGLLALLACNLYNNCIIADRDGSSHLLLRLFSYALGLQCLSAICWFIWYLIFSLTGEIHREDVESLQWLGELLSIMAHGVFVLLLLCLAKGWTISTEGLQNRNLVLGLVGAFSGIRLIMLFWSWAIEDLAAVAEPTVNVVLWYMLLVAWTALAGFFVVTCVQSYRHENDAHKRSLYLRLLMTFSPWFAGLPLVAWLVLGLPGWKREKVVRSVSESITFIAFAAMQWLTWHVRASEYFKVSTPKVGYFFDDVGFSERDGLL